MKCQGPMRFSVVFSDWACSYGGEDKMIWQCGTGTMHRNGVVSFCLSFVENVARVDVWLLSNSTVEFAFGILEGLQDHVIL